MCLNILFWLSSDRLSGFFTSFHAHGTLYLLRVFHYLIYYYYYYYLFILAVQMRECLGKHSCMSSPFPIAILNDTFIFRETRLSFRSNNNTYCNGSFQVKRTRGPHFTISDFDEILPVASYTFQTRFDKVLISDNQWLVYKHHQYRGDICCWWVFHDK